MVLYCFSTCDNFYRANPIATNLETFRQCLATQTDCACQLISTVYPPVINTAAAIEVRLFLGENYYSGRIKTVTNYPLTVVLSDHIYFNHILSVFSCTELNQVMRVEQR